MASFHNSDSRFLAAAYPLHRREGCDDMSTIEQFTAAYAVLMVASAWNAKALAPSIVAGLALLAMYPDASFIPAFFLVYIAAYFMSGMRP